ncbi:MAG TPA: aromatic-ring-hydroxylating dioxygenase subunit beta [Burkholderiales bacterium]|nr:aromatic-ring-hydroxylating dioxygenase subunit beta [Burkholderiales bacterium]
MSEAEIERAIVALNHRYARCLDENRLDEWPEFFIEEGRYLIQPRDNLDQGLEGYWLYFENKRMLRDRVVSLKDVNIYKIHYERRLVTNVEVTGRDGDGWLARANYLVMHTDNEGRSTLFSVGEYRDRIVKSDGALRFSERRVIVDTFVVPSHLSMPI